MDKEKFKIILRKLILNSLSSQEEFFWFLTYCFNIKRGKDPTIKELNQIATGFQIGIFDPYETIKKIAIDKDSYGVDITLVKDKESNIVNAIIT